MPCHFSEPGFDPEEVELTLRSPLGRWLWKTRVANNLSTKKLAHMAKTTQEIVNQLESDPDIISKIQVDSEFSHMRPVLARLSAALGMPPTTLFMFLE